MAFNPQSTLVATGSMDATAKLWDVETGEEVATLTVRFFTSSQRLPCSFFSHGSHPFNINALINFSFTLNSHYS